MTRRRSIYFPDADADLVAWLEQSGAFNKKLRSAVREAMESETGVGVRDQGGCAGCSAPQVDLTPIIKVLTAMEARLSRIERTLTENPVVVSTETAAQEGQGLELSAGDGLIEDIWED